MKERAKCAKCGIVYFEYPGVLKGLKSRNCKTRCESCRSSKTDGLSTLRGYLFRAKRRAEKRGEYFGINLLYLKKLWDDQKGVCPYTGWQMQMAPSWRYALDHSPEKASLDRIDSSKGYIPGNVQFVSLIAQYAKNDFSEEQFVEFCKAVVRHSKNKARRKKAIPSKSSRAVRQV